MCREVMAPRLATVVGLLFQAYGLQHTDRALQPFIEDMPLGTRFDSEPPSGAGLSWPLSALPWRPDEPRSAGTIDPVGGTDFFGSVDVPAYERDVASINPVGDVGMRLSSGHLSSGAARAALAGTRTADAGSTVAAVAAAAARHCGGLGQPPCTSVTITSCQPGTLRCADGSCPPCSQETMPQLPATSASATIGPGQAQVQSGSCHPQCFYKCEDVRCDEVCTPVCEKSLCETRCQQADLSSCREDCSQPDCRTQCPQRQCASATCPHCDTVCGAPVCRLNCTGVQACFNVCEHPRCDWKCHTPEVCPEPKCTMHCEQPKHCAASFHQGLPPLLPGETAVAHFMVGPDAGPPPAGGVNEAPREQPPQQPPKDNTEDLVPDFPDKVDINTDMNALSVGRLPERMKVDMEVPESIGR